jgi:hypothetical protein
MLWLIRQIFSNKGGKRVAIVETNEVKQKHHALLTSFKVKIPQLTFLPIAVHATNPAKGEAAIKGIPQQLPPQLALHLFHFLYGKQRDRNGSGSDGGCFLMIGRRGCIYKRIVVAVGEVAPASFVHLLPEFCQNRHQVLRVLVLVYDLMHLLHGSEKLGQFEHRFLVECLLPLLQKIFLVDENIGRVYEMRSLVSDVFIPLATLRPVRVSHQIILIQKLHGQDTIAQLLLRLDQARVQLEQLLGEWHLGGVADEQPEPNFFVKVGEEGALDVHYIIVQSMVNAYH